MRGFENIRATARHCKNLIAMTTPRTVTACVLIIGNEILSGRTQDTNLNHLAKTLGDWGIQVREARLIPDIEAEIIEAVNTMRRKFDYLFTTGGIGPTHDDITAASVAKAFDVPLVTNPVIEARIRRARSATPSDGIAPAHGAHSRRRHPGGQRHRRPAGFRIENVYVMAAFPRSCKPCWRLWKTSWKAALRSEAAR